MKKLRFENHSREVRAALKALDGALESIGAAAAGHARQALVERGAVDTGALRDSVAYEVSGREVAVGSPLPYAAVIELGDGAGRAARPYLTPALLDHGPEYAEIVKRSLQEAEG